MVNLVATIAGVRKERIVIAGHYDTSSIASSGSSAPATAGRARRFPRARARAEVAQEPDDD
jgi:hypothetical protein